MTFAVVLIQDDRHRVVGTLWADDENNARALAPHLCECAEGGRLTICRTENREIPFRIAPAEPMKFC
jgi:hypothetical protein